MSDRPTEPAGLGEPGGRAGPAGAGEPGAHLAGLLVAALRARAETVATAESLTGGLVCARIVDVPGASAVLRGGVIAYATELKHALLGVDAALLAREGAVHPAVAVMMAEGVRTRLGAVHGVATTGVAGPTPQHGHLPGTVHVAVAGPQGTAVRSLALPVAGQGTRAQIRAAAVEAALGLLLSRLS